MELTRIEKFSALNDKLPNLKEIDGTVISPVAHLTRTYEDKEGNEHQVLVVKDGKSGKLYKTEVKAFINKFLNYLETFGDCPDDELPDIKIACRDSKAGNKYVNFDLVAPEA